MSDLPERRKSAAELAELRETLGISKDGPPPGVPGVAKTVLPSKKKEVVVEELKSAVFEAPKDEPEPEPEAKPEVPKLKQVMSLRKSERGPVGPPRKVTNVESGKIPVRRHTDKELTKLKQVEKHADEAPAEHLAHMAAGLFSLIALYGLGILLIVASCLGVAAGKAPSMDLPGAWLVELVRRPDYSMILYGLLAGGAAVLLLGALWIYFVKVRSRHHAGFMTIIAVLVLVFGTLYFFPHLHGA